MSAAAADVAAAVSGTTKLRRWSVDDLSWTSEIGKRPLSLSDGRKCTEFTTLRRPGGGAVSAQGEVVEYHSGSAIREHEEWPRNERSRLHQTLMTFLETRAAVTKHLN